jgi:hypothetical protein
VGGGEPRRGRRAQGDGARLGRVRSFGVTYVSVTMTA